MANHHFPSNFESFAVAAKGCVPPSAKCEIPMFGAWLNPSMGGPELIWSSYYILKKNDAVHIKYPIYGCVHKNQFDVPVLDSLIIEP